MKKRLFSLIFVLVIFLFCIFFIIIVLKNLESDSIVELALVTQTDNASNNVFGLSAADIINSAIGAFLGVGSTLLTEALLVSFNKKKSINNIILEIISVKEGVSEEITSSVSVTLKKCLSRYCTYSDALTSMGTFSDTDIQEIDSISRRLLLIKYVIYIPIWESVSQNGDLLRFKNKKYFEELILVYTRIYKIQSLVNDYEYNEGDYEVPWIILRECLELEHLLSNDGAHELFSLINSKIYS